MKSGGKMKNKNQILGINNIFSSIDTKNSNLSRYSIWKRNKATLWYYPSPEKKYITPIFLIYSLVNRPDILDLHPGLSVIESFILNGFDVYLIDFGTPGYEDKDITLDDYIEKYIQKGVQRALLHSNAKEITVIGYCLGGTLAAIYTAIAKEPVKNLILYVTPLDFSTVPSFDTWAKALREDAVNFDEIITVFGILPPAFVKVGMRLLTSPVYITPYLSLISRANDEAYVRKWLSFNRWMKSYLPLVGATVRNLMNDLVKDNKLVKGKLLINGKKANLKNITCNLLVISSEEDRLVSKEQTYSIIELASSKDKTYALSKNGHAGFSVKKGHLPEYIDQWLPPRS